MQFAYKPGSEHFMKKVRETTGNVQGGRILWMTIYLLLLSFFFVAGFAHQFKYPGRDASFSSFLAGILFFDRFIAEYLFAAAVILLLINGNLLCRLLSYLILGLFLFINSVQLTSIAQGGEFLSRLALDNINHINILLNVQTLFIPFVAVIALLIPEAVIHLARLQPSSRKSLFLAVAPFILLGIFFSQSHWWLPESVEEKRTLFFSANNIDHTAPAIALYKTVFQQNMDFFSENLSREELRRLRQFGIILNPDKPYPLLKKRIYQGDPPFQQITPDSAAPNIIVFFNEGISARSLSVYGSKYQDITPYLQDFARHSMVVTNYFNHTAATYRGLHGQLCSLFPTFGGNGGWYPNYQELKRIKYLSLTELLNQQGYQTIFLDSHLKDKAYVDDMMQTLDFQEVLTADELRNRFLSGEKPALEDALSDTQFFQSLIELLREKATRKKTGKPFFIGLYNFGTHSWVNSADDEAHFGDGWNPFLNTIHNLDAAFGLFWKYFQNSPFADNTIVIFTTDHCHYPTQPFVAEIDDPEYQRLFVDRIPLIILDQQRKLPAYFDAANSTSLDFAPSLLHYLGITNQPNPFLGRSIFFQQDQTERLGVAVIEPDIFIIDGKKIHGDKNSKLYRQDLQLLKKFIKISHGLEMTDRLWHKQPAD